MGRHDYGRLGLGDQKKDAVTPTLIETLKDEPISCISAAGAVSMIVSESGESDILAY